MTPRAEGGNFTQRELSWLQFNQRVLDEASIPANSAAERLRFLAISDSNLDEFFMVRVANLRWRVANGLGDEDEAGEQPPLAEILRRCQERAAAMMTEQRQVFSKILQKIADDAVVVRRYFELDETAKLAADTYFTETIQPQLTPRALPKADFLPNFFNSDVIHVAARCGENVVCVEIPDSLPRFVPLKSATKPKKFLVPVEEIALANVDQIFRDKVTEKLLLRLLRDMYFSVYGAGEPLDAVSRLLNDCKKRAPIRLEFQGDGGEFLLDQLRTAFHLDAKLCYRQSGFLRLKQVAELAEKLPNSGKTKKMWGELIPPPFAKNPKSPFKAIRKYGEILLCPPYHSFNVITDLLETAAVDPDVVAIKQTLYRVSPNSRVVAALRKAARNGKQVTVAIEVRARFDEEANIEWARKLIAAGAHVLYGLPDLKLHAKALYILRSEKGGLRPYVHLGTGNYSEENARFYADCGLFTVDPQICADTVAFFNALTGGDACGAEYHELVLSPNHIRDFLTEKIEREIECAKQGKPARIIVKVNSFSDFAMARLMHRVAQSGVKIDVITRGVCGFTPLPTENNVRVVSIIDHYLEHSRIFYFANGGDEEFYLSSADWMARNFDRRVEMLFPVKNAVSRDILRRLLEWQLRDTDKARVLRADGTWEGVFPKKYGEARSQLKFHDFLKTICKNAR